MFQMNDAQKEIYDHLLHSLKHADSIEETRYYFAEIQHYLDTLQIENGSSSKKMDLKELKKYEWLRQKMIEATSKEEVTFYEKKIHKLISQMNIT